MIDASGTALASRESVSQLLHASADGAIEHLRQLAADVKLAYSPNTLRTWRADWRVWCAYCEANGYPPIPAELPAIRGFLMDRVAAGRKRATIEHYISTLTAAHRLAKLPSPMDSMEARLMWRGIRRNYLTSRQRQAKGLTSDDVDAMVEAMKGQSAMDIRDAALLHLAYESMFRREELVNIKVADLSFETDGSGRLFLAQSKTDQEGVGVLQYLSPQTVGLVKAWLEISSVSDGELFRSTPNSSKPNRFERPLSGRDVARIFKRRALAAGIDPERVSGHSTRVGATQDLLEANFSGPEIMRQGRWKSERMVVRYSENIEVKRGAMAKLRGDRHKN